MFKKIRKRNGSIVDFDIKKIENAIEKAFDATQEVSKDIKENKKIAEKLSNKVVTIAEKKFDKKQIPSVEDIQDLVERVLMQNNYLETAKSYILYREQHARLREIVNKANIGLVSDYLTRADWQVNENSNMEYSLQGLNNYISSEISKIYWLNKVYPKEIKEACLNAQFHIHDLNLLSVYCVGWDLYDLLIKGFRGVRGKVETKPARHFVSALGQVINFFYTLQGEAAGAQAFSNFDTLLAPFIRYDKLNYEQVKQHLQFFLFNINVPTRVGFQTPFTNISLDLTVPSYFAKQPFIRGGKPMKETYSEFQEEMDIFNKALLEVLEKGDLKGRVFTFPIPTYNITKDFDFDNPNLQNLWKVTAKYGIPYFSNFVNSDMKPEDARSMCCRLRIDNRKLERRGGGLFGSSPKTGSIGVVTINMPQIGYLSRNKKEFFERLEHLMILAKESLEIKRKVLEKFTENGLYPYTMFYLGDIKKRFGEYWKNHFSTIGLVGMNEACLNLFGKNSGTKKGKEFTLAVLDFMRKKLILFQQESGNNYNLEATPAEGTSYRLAKKDKENYHKIICANEKAYQKGADPFYTNSSHLPVNYTDDVFEVFDLQDEIQKKYTGGTVLHIFLGERIKDPKIVKKLIKKICNTYHLPYFTLTPTFSICYSHGYINGEHEKCPKCGSPTEIYSRVVGYLRPVQQWNKGKKAEFKQRKTFKIIS